MRPKLLPEGYRLWIWPRYRLETPSVCLQLPSKTGSLLAILVSNRNKKMWASEILEAIHIGNELGGPSSTGIISTQIMHLKHRLEAVGITIDVESVNGSPGYTFKSFGVRDPVVGRYVKNCLKPRVRKKKPVAPVNGPPRRPDQLPVSGENDICAGVPWSFPPRIEKRMRSQTQMIKKIQELQDE